MSKVYRESETDEETWTMAVAVTEGYTREYADDFDKYDVLSTELMFAIPLTDDDIYTGTIDLVLREKSTGRVWFADYKTTTSIDRYDKASDMDRQISRYWWALQQLASGLGQVFNQKNNTWDSIFNSRLFDDLTAPYGFFYNIILKSYPVAPKELKGGKLSKDKSQNTTYELYEQAIAERGLEHDNYVDFLQFLRETPREYFRRLEVVKLQPQINNSVEELSQITWDIKTVRMIKKNSEITRRNPIYRNITHDCSWDCPFLTICEASLDGSDIEWMIEQEFIKEEPK